MPDYISIHSGSDIDAAVTKVIDWSTGGGVQVFNLGHFDQGGHGIKYSGGTLQVRGSLQGASIDWSQVIDDGGKPANGATVNRIFWQASPPASPTSGDLWFNTNDFTLNRWGGTWQVVGTNDAAWRHTSDITAIDGGKIYAGSQVSIGQGGFIRINPLKTFGDTTPGLWAGHHNGAYKFDLYNDADSFIRMTPSGLEIRGSIQVTGGSIPWSFIEDAPAPGVGDELVADWDLQESGWISWTVIGDGTQPARGFYGEGKSGIRMYAPGAGKWIAVSSSVVPVRDYAYVTVRVRNNGLSGSTVSLYSWQYDAAGSYLGTSSVSITGSIGSGNWTTVTARISLLTGAAKASFGVHLVNGTAGSLDLSWVSARSHELGATNDSQWRHASDITLIDGGKIYAGSLVKIGTSSGGSLVINNTKGTCGDGVTGVFLGYSGGWKFEIYGNSSNYLRWDGTSLELKGTLTVTGGSGLANFSDAGALATKNAADYTTDVTGAKPPFGATPGSCFILDPTFEESAGSWFTYWFRSHTDVLMSTSYGEAGYGVRIPAPGSGNSHYITNVPTNTAVAQNDVIYIAARLKSNSLNGSVYLRVWMYDYNKSYLTSSSADVTSKLVSGSWVTVTARVTVTHASARYCRVGISVADSTTGSLDVDNFYAYAHDPGATNDADIRASADQTKIDGGKLYVGSQIKIGSTSGGYLIINQDKTGYADGQPGVFLGYSSGWKFEIYGSSSHYLRWDGSTLTVRGALSASNLTTGTLPMDRIAAGSITASKIAAGTITAAEIASGTITANEINGSSFGVLTISSGRIIANVSQAFVVGQSGTLAFYVYNGTGAYIQGGTSQYLKVYSPYYVQVVGTNIYLDANTTYLRYGSSTPLLAVGTTYVITYTDILPNVTQTCWVGNSSLRFQGAYFYNLYIRNYYSFDTVDDLAFIENIPVVKDATGGLEVDADGRSIVDVSSCDLRITNARHLCAELSQETGTIITPSDLETLRNGKMTEIAGPKGSVRWSEVADRLSLDVGALCGLYIGALKQVSGRLKALEERMRGHS